MHREGEGGSRRGVTQQANGQIGHDVSVLRLQVKSSRRGRRCGGRTGRHRPRREEGAGGKGGGTRVLPKRDKSAAARGLVPAPPCVGGDGGGSRLEA